MVVSRRSRDREGAADRTPEEVPSVRRFASSAAVALTVLASLVALALGSGDPWLGS